jgi:hypothetical protein
MRAETLREVVETIKAADLSVDGVIGFDVSWAREKCIAAVEGME